MKKIILSLAFACSLIITTSACNSTKNASDTTDSTMVDTTMTPIDTTVTDTTGIMPPDTTLKPM